MASETEYVFYSSKLPNNNYAFFEDMRRKGILCDITFKVGDHSVSAHRIVLAAGIPYFRDAIYNGAAMEASETEIEIPEIDYSGFEALIEFVYSCKITITFENVKDLLSAACALQVEEVREACCKFLKDRLDPQTVFDVRRYAHNLQCLDLVDTADYYIRENFDQVSQSESFLNLSFLFLEELIRKDDLRVSSEEAVFESVIRWVKSAPAERSAELPELLKSVRLTLLNPRYLRDRVASQEFIRTSISCRDLLDEAVNYHLFPEKRQELFSFPTKPRNFKDTEENKTSAASDAAACVLSKEPTNVMAKDKKLGIYKIEATTMCLLRCFDSEKNEWYTYSNSTILHNKGSAVALNSNLYLFLKDCTLELDPQNDSLQFYAGSERLYTAAAVFDGYVYLCGGIGSTCTATNRVDRFDTQTKEWEEVPDMISHRRSPGVATLEECLYVLGGMKKGSNILSGVESYSTEDDYWILQRPMLTRRYDLGSAALNGKIYVCGGMGTLGWLNSAEVFDPVKKQWKMISPMNSTGSKCSLLPYFGKLYAVGASMEGSISLSTVEIYNPKTDEWFLSQSEDASSISGAAVIL